MSTDTEITANTPVTEDNWLDVMRAEAEDTSKQAVGDAIGYARPSVSLALLGNYKGSLRKMRKAYMAYKQKIPCAYLADDVPPSYCEDKACRDAPTQNPSEMRHWRACQNCEHNPKENV